MAETIRSLIVVIFLILLGFYLLNGVLTDKQVKKKLTNWLILWLTVTPVAFIIPNYWVLAGLTGSVLIVVAKRKHSDIVAIYLASVLILPNLTYKIPGFGGINNLINISWPRISVFCLLLPLLLKRLKQTPDQGFFRMPPDKLVFSYIVLTSILAFRDTSFTEGLRSTLYNILDIFIPYYVISRSVNSYEAFKGVFYSILFSILVISLCAIFETVFTWHLYDSLNKTFSYKEQTVTSYKFRGGLLRANAAFGSIPLGYIISIGLSCGLFLFRGRLFDVKVLAVMGAMTLGLLATVSRGPWVGFFIMAAIYTLLGPRGVTNVFKVSAIGLVLMPVILVSPVGQKFIDMLPFIGDDHSDTISYRQRLFEQSIKVIKRNPLFGSTNYLDTPEMQSMMQGEGIIDLVNTYLQIALEYGFVGAITFMLVFISVTVKIFKLRTISKSNRYLNMEMYDLGNLLFSITIGIMAVIATVSGSGQGIISIFYWSFAALGAAYVRLAKKTLLEQKQSVPS